MESAGGKPGSKLKEYEGGSVPCNESSEGDDLTQQSQARDPVSLLHDVNNVFVAILLNAQIIEWKLPSYSRLKRNVHEIERGARRGAVIVSRLRAMTTGEMEKTGVGITKPEESC